MIRKRKIIGYHTTLHSLQSFRKRMHGSMSAEDFKNSKAGHTSVPIYEDGIQTVTCNSCERYFPEDEVAPGTGTCHRCITFGAVGLLVSVFLLILFVQTFHDVWWLAHVATPFVVYYFLIRKLIGLTLTDIIKGLK